MHIPFSTITTFYILLDFADITIAHNRDELDLMFRQRCVTNRRMMLYEINQ